MIPRFSRLAFPAASRWRRRAIRPLRAVAKVEDRAGRGDLQRQGAALRPRPAQRLYDRRRGRGRHRRFRQGGRQGASCPTPTAAARCSPMTFRPMSAARSPSSARGSSTASPRKWPISSFANFAAAVEGRARRLALPSALGLERAHGTVLRASCLCRRAELGDKSSSHRAWRAGRVAMTVSRRPRRGPANWRTFEPF